MLAALFNVITPSGTAEVPNAPLKLTAPLVPASKVVACAFAVVPRKPLANVMLAPAASTPLLVVSNNVLALFKTTGLLNNMDDGPLVLTIEPLKVVLKELVSKCKGAAP